VDAQLRVYGVKNQRIADGSIMRRSRPATPRCLRDHPILKT
jgi:choline dehydrogenase-like flavoprotein